MIAKHFRLLKAIPIFYFANVTSATANKNPKQLSQVFPSLNQSPSDSMLSSYLFRKYQINQHLKPQIMELLSAIQAHKSSYSNQQLQVLRNILSNLQIDVITQSNAKYFLNLLYLAKKRKILNDTSTIIKRFQQQMKSFDFQSQSSKKLINLYRIQNNQQSHIRVSNAETLLQEMSTNKKLEINAQQISQYFQKLTSVYELQQTEKQVRLFFFKVLKQQLEHLSIEVLSRIGMHLNAINHYDFVDQQLIVVEEIFNMMKKGYKKMIFDTLTEVFGGQQCSTNEINLSEFYGKVVSSLILEVKRHNSLQSHIVFDLIGLAHSKLTKSLQNSFVDVTKYQAFILKHIEVNGKAKKHNDKINEVICILLSNNCISKNRLKQLIVILSEINFAPSLRCIYEFVANKVNGISNFLPKSIVQKFMGIVQFISIGGLSLLQTVLLAIALHKTDLQCFSSMRKEIDKKICKYFESPQYFARLFNQLKNSKIPHLLQNFHQVYGVQFQQLSRKIESSQKNTNQEHQLIILEYLMTTIESNFDEKEKLKENYKLMSMSMLQTLLEQQLKDHSSQNIGKVILLICPVNLTQISSNMQKLLLLLFIRFTKVIRLGTDTKAERYDFWRQMVRLAMNSDIFLKNQVRQQIKSLYIVLLQKLLSYQGYLHNKEMFTICEELQQKLANFAKYAKIQNLIIKRGLYYGLTSPKHIQILANIDNSIFDQIQGHKINYLDNNTYAPQIESKLTQLSVSLIINNPNLSNLTNEMQKQISDVIETANLKTLQRYYIDLLVNTNFHSGYKFLNKIMNKILEKSDYSQLNLLLIFKYLEKRKTFSFPTHKFVVKCIQSFLVKTLKISDFQIHLSIVRMLPQWMNENSELISTYIKNILECINSEEKSNKEKFLFYVLFTDYRYDWLEISRMLNVKNLQYLSTTFFLLENRYSEVQRTALLNRMLQAAESEYLQKQKVDILIDYQYRYLKKKYPLQMQNFNLPQNCFKKYVFSSMATRMREFITSIYEYLGIEVKKVADFGNNDIYKIRNNYVIAIEGNKQFSPNEFAYYQRLLKCHFGGDKKISIIVLKKRQSSAYFSLLQVVKLDPILTTEEWNDYFKPRERRNLSKQDGQIKERENQIQYTKVEKKQEGERKKFEFEELHRRRVAKKRGGFQKPRYKL